MIIDVLLPYNLIQYSLLMLLVRIRCAKQAGRCLAGIYNCNLGGWRLDRGGRELSFGDFKLLRNPRDDGAKCGSASQRPTSSD
jgi:hypothetical protein